MLAKLNVRYVIAGHSERRELFGETDESVNKKVLAILRHGMTPILCCGETLEEREAGDTETKVRGQVRGGPARASAADQVGGAGHRLRAHLGHRHRSHGQQRRRPGGVRGRAGRRSAEVAGADAAAAVRIQYGGSVKPANAAELMAQPDIDGALVGGASLDADDFARIVRTWLTAGDPVPPGRARSEAPEERSSARPERVCRSAAAPCRLPQCCGAIRDRRQVGPPPYRWPMPGRATSVLSPVAPHRHEEDPL